MIDSQEQYYISPSNSIRIETLTIEPGVDKSGQPENCGKIEISCGQLVGITGPTGSGKSRLLADIEYLAQGDTPTQRRIRLDGAAPAGRERFSPVARMVAQVSQNMNFVLDLRVGEFLALHAGCRCRDNVSEIIAQVFVAANSLAGEPFTENTPLSALSGGQSRALMIADVAWLSDSPIVVIDEIENAGIDRRQALELLVGRRKIVLIATHDPILALMTDFRLVFRHGAIDKVVYTSNQEKELLTELYSYDHRLAVLRENLRHGRPLL